MSNSKDLKSKSTIEIKVLKTNVLGDNELKALSIVLRNKSIRHIVEKQKKLKLSGHSHLKFLVKDFLD